MTRAALPQIRAVGTAFLRQRPVVTVPLAVAFVALVVAAGAPTAQVGALALGLGSVQAMFIAERVIGARRPLSERALARSLVTTSLGILAGAAITGGIASPLLPLVLAPTGVAFAAFGPGRVSAVVLAIVVVAAGALAALPPGVPFPPLASPARELGAALSLIASAILLRLGVTTLADTHAAAAAVLSRAGDDAAAAAAARARALDNLGARVAHEVRNPLAAIRGLVEVMLEAHAAAPTERDHRRLVVVAGEVERIEQILRDYLDHHRPVTELERAPVDLATIARDVVAVLEARAARADVTLTATGATTIVSVDARRLKEAILNLALNALDATAAGQRVAVRWSAAGAHATIEIADTGRGMTDGELAQVGTAGFTTRRDGLGLGVVLARAVITQHGGQLAFSSVPGRGTIATIQLPWQPS